MCLISSSRRWRLKEATNDSIPLKGCIPRSFQVPFLVEEWNGVRLDGSEGVDHRGVPLLPQFETNVMSLLPDLEM